MHQRGGVVYKCCNFFVTGVPVSRLNQWHRSALTDVSCSARWQALHKLGRLSHAHALPPDRIGFKWCTILAGIVKLCAWHNSQIGLAFSLLLRSLSHCRVLYYLRACARFIVLNKKGACIAPLLFQCFCWGIICASAINELNTGKPYKDRGAGRKFGLGHGLQAMQSAFCWRLALRYIIPFCWLAATNWLSARSVLRKPFSAA